ncbi:MAG: transposase [Actinomycetes bacterium]
MLALWHKARRSVLKSRQHLVNEAESLLAELPNPLREALPATKAVRPRLAAAAGLSALAGDAVNALRLRLLGEHWAAIAELDRREREIARELDAALGATGSTVGELCGLATRSVAELLVEVGDQRRFTEGGFARFNGSAPLAASTAEGPGEPVRHRWNHGGNRRVNAILHRMAVTQLRCEPRAQAIFAEARRRGHTKREARRVLKRHLSDVIYRRMIRDLNDGRAAAPAAA